MKLVETVMAKRKRHTGITAGNRKKLAKTEGFHVGDFVWAKLPSLTQDENSPFSQLKHF